MPKPSSGPQNGMFATAHVTHTAYEHMCFQQRVVLEEELAFKAHEQRRNSMSPTSELDELESSEERLPDPAAATRCASPTSVRMSGGKKGTSPRGSGRHGSSRSSRSSRGSRSPGGGSGSGRRHAAKLVAAKVEQHKSRSRSRSRNNGQLPQRPGSAAHGGSRSPTTDTNSNNMAPSIFETGNPHTHQDEFVERRRHPHRPNLRTNWELSHASGGQDGGGDPRQRQQCHGRTRSPSGSPKGSGPGASPLFTAIRANAAARKEEQRRLLEQQRRRREAYSSSPPPVYAANSDARLTMRVESHMRPKDRVSEIQGFASDPTVSLARFENAQRAKSRANGNKRRPQSAGADRAGRSRSPSGSPTSMHLVGNTRTLDTGIVEHKVAGTWTPDVAEAAAAAAWGEVATMEEEEERIAVMVAQIDARLARSTDSRFVSESPRGRAGSAGTATLRERATAANAGVDSRAGKVKLEAHIFEGLRR